MRVWTHLFWPRPVMRMSELYILTVISMVTMANTAMYAMPPSTRVMSPYMRACMAIIGCENGMANRIPCRNPPHPYHPENMITNMGIMARMLMGRVMVWADL